MSRKTTTQTTATPSATITDEMFGNFAVCDNNERVWKQVYYALLSRQGLSLRNKEGFKWDEFKKQFAEVFGTPEQHKVTLDQMLKYAMKKFGMSQQDLIDAHKRSWQRRRTWELQQQVADMVDDDINLQHFSETGFN